MQTRFLLVDDDETLTRLNEKILRAAGLVKELHAVRTGRGALEFLMSAAHNRNPLPQIIILDLDMPVMNGFQFLDEFWKLNLPGKETIELVVFTASSIPSNYERVLSKGVKHYLNKPFLLREITAIVHNLKAGGRLSENAAGTIGTN